jgi:Icc-related predicted phosphoesterase
MEDSVAPYRELFAEISSCADVLLLAGDLTNFGKTREAEILAEDLGACTIPVLGVLGNHDYECGQPDQVADILRQGGMTLLDEQAVEIDGVGFAGVKGFLGGFGRGELAPFGEPIVKAFVDEALNEARKLENQLRTLRTSRSVAMLHYSPIVATIEGEQPEIFQYLGSQRLCEPIDRFEHVKAVVYGHAHHGSYEGKTPLGKPVYNVAQFVVRPLFGRPYAMLEV